MRRLFRLLALRPRLRARRWRLRALAAEAQRDELRELLEAETERNRYREDTFVSATVMGGRQMYGLAARNGPAMKRVGRSSTIPAPQASDAWDMLTWAERQEFQVYYWPDAEAASVPLATARQHFMAELASRKQPLNDDFDGAN